MPQDQQTGAAASVWGRETGHRIAHELGARPLSRTSNECMLGRERIVIKCAKPATDSVGVTFKMLERISRVFGAFQQEDGTFDIWALSSAVFAKHMRDSRSQGASAGKVGLVRRGTFYSLGSHIARVRLT